MNLYRKIMQTGWTMSKGRGKAYERRAHKRRQRRRTQRLITKMERSKYDS